MIIFARHGQTELNRDGRLQGRIDAALSPLGQEQATRVAVALESEPITRVVASPLQRAQQTAAAIAARHELAVETDDRLIELDYGDWDGAVLADVPGEQWAAWRSDPEFAPPGGERLSAVSARVASFLVDQPNDGLIVAVSHVSPIKAAVCFALGVDELVTWRMHLGVAAITRIGRRADGAPFLVSFNEQA